MVLPHLVVKVGFEHGFLLPNASQIRCEELMEKENHVQIQLSLSNEVEVKQSGEENGSAVPDPIRFHLVWSRSPLILIKMSRQSCMAMRAPTKNQIYFPYLTVVFSS